MGAPKKSLFLILLCFSDIFMCRIVAEGVTKEEAKQLRDEVISFFMYKIVLISIASEIFG